MDKSVIVRLLVMALFRNLLVEAAVEDDEYFLVCIKKMFVQTIKIVHLHIMTVSVDIVFLLRLLKYPVLHVHLIQMN